MRIGILTHPQGVNYGGILQCYAFCTYLRKNGHDPMVIHRQNDKAFFLWEWTRSLLRLVHFPRYYNSNEVDKGKKIRPFIDNHLKRTMPVRSQSQMKKICRRYQLDAVIVGSDQVWRKDFAIKFGYNYFLDFVPHGVRKLSYAASFGLNEWQYDEEQNKVLTELLTKFKGVSVREFEAIGLLKENLGIDAVQQVDPTLLLNAEEYSNISSPRLVVDGYVFVYWLGAKEAVEKKISEIEESGVRVVKMFLRDNEEQMSVEDWLSYIKYANQVITDSFHGCVFSIIFSRPFIISFNNSGGIGRLSSLFKILNIENEVKENSPIDYAKVHACIEELQAKSKTFILSRLK